MKSILVIIACLVSFQALAGSEQIKYMLRNNKGFDVLKYDYTGVKK